MKLYELLHVINDAYDHIDVYTTTEVEWHKTLYEGPAGELMDWLHHDVYAVYAAEEACFTYDSFEGTMPVLCIGIG